MPVTNLFPVLEVKTYRNSQDGCAFREWILECSNEVHNGKVIILWVEMVGFNQILNIPYLWHSLWLLLMGILWLPPPHIFAKLVVTDLFCLSRSQALISGTGNELCVTGMAQWVQIYTMTIIYNFSKCCCSNIVGVNLHHDDPNFSKMCWQQWV